VNAHVISVKREIMRKLREAEGRRDEWDEIGAAVLSRA
jgi:hypothetical protein